MALSLREKLQMAHAAAPKTPPRPAAEDCAVFTERFEGNGTGLEHVLSDRTLYEITGRAWPRVEREEILFLDTETNGLSGGVGTVAFLVGMGYYRDGDFIVEQLFLRDYGEEAFLIRRLGEILRSFPYLCTFNGTSFDVPLLRSRFIMQGERMPEPRMHLDLIHPVRRVWKLRIEKCSLSTVEEKVLHLPRTHDLPGAQVPERYRRYLLTGDEGVIRDVLDHNRQDILSLPLVLSALIRAHEAPEEQEDPEDIYSLGRIFDQRRDPEKARMCYRLSSRGSTRFLAGLSLAELDARSGRWQEAAEGYENLLRSRQSVKLYVALSKIFEHRMKDYDRAARCALRACEISGDADRELTARLLGRAERNLKKARRKSNGTA